MYALMRSTLVPYENEFTSISSVYNEINRRKENTKSHREKLDFINRLKYAQKKILCISIDVYKLFEGNDFNGNLDVIWNLKNRK